MVAPIVQQKTEGSDRPGIGYSVPVVDHNRDPMIAGVYLVDQRGKDIALGVLAVLFEGRAQGLGQSRTDPAD